MLIIVNWAKMSGQWKTVSILGQAWPKKYKVRRINLISICCEMAVSGRIRASIQQVPARLGDCLHRKLTMKYYSATVKKVPIAVVGQCSDNGLERRGLREKDELGSDWSNW